MSEITASPTAGDNELHEDALQEFTLKQNIAELSACRDENINKYTQAVTDITATLVDLRWKHRHQLFPYRVKEEVLGAVLSEIIVGHPALKEKILERLEANYQQIRTREAQTLSLTRSMLEGTYKTPNL